MSNTIGNNVFSRRKQMNMTGTELGNKVGVSSSMIYAIESGEKKPGVETLIALAKAFKCKVDDLVH